MPIDDLPAEVISPTRDELKANWLRRHRILVPDADTGPGTEPDVRASVAVDSVLPLFAIGKRSSDNLVVTEAQFDAVDQWLEIEGLDQRKEADGALGYGSLSASAGGGQVVSGDELVHEPTGLRYEALVTGTFPDGTPILIHGVDTGPETNQVVGTVLKWTSGRPGRAATVAVADSGGGQGLIGGRRRETDGEAIQRILDARRNPADSGNDAEYIALTEKTPGVAVQKAFAYPCIIGPGTIQVAFTALPSAPGGSRVPTAAQLAEAEAYVVGQMPADDGAFFVAITEVNLDVVYGITWHPNAEGWSDLVQWPPYYQLSAGPGAIRVSAVTSPTVFTLATNDGVYTGVPQPQNGQTIAFYDGGSRVFRAKRILSFTGTGPWVITCDTTNNASDTSYAPVVNQRACPWSNSLDDLVPGILAYADTLGPGQAAGLLYDEGRRVKRQPEAPTEWPHNTTERGMEDAIAVDAVSDRTVLEGGGVSPGIGTFGTSVPVLRLRYISAFPQ